MRISKILLVLALGLMLMSIAGCKKADKTAQLCAFPYDVKVVFSGPGGHSNGAYGKTNALHAASTAVEAMVTQTAPEGVIFNINALSGGNSVNSIAGGAELIVEGCAKTEAAATAFADFVKANVQKGLDTENAFRNVKSGETNADGVRIDISAEITKI